MFTCISREQGYLSPEIPCEQTEQHARFQSNGTPAHQIQKYARNRLQLNLEEAASKNQPQVKSLGEPRVEN